MLERGRAGEIELDLVGRHMAGQVDERRDGGPQQGQRAQQGDRRRAPSTLPPGHGLGRTRRDLHRSLVHGRFSITSIRIVTDIVSPGASTWMPSARPLFLRLIQRGIGVADRLGHGEPPLAGE